MYTDILRTIINITNRIYLIVFPLLYILSQGVFSQGLKFNGSEFPIDKRTSFCVFKDKSPDFTTNFNMSFDISFYMPTQTGYIFRIKDEDNGYNTIYNMYYEGQGNTLMFKFNEEGKSSLITAKIEKSEVYNKWLKMDISFNLEQKSITLAINNEKFNISDINFPNKYSPHIVFGKSDYIIDVPSFAIKNLSIGNKKRYFFALKESEGEFVHNEKNQIIGFVSNPEWLINEAFHWNFKKSFHSKTVAGANYSTSNEVIYYFNSDSITTYNIRTEEVKKIAFKNKCPLHLILGTNFIDTEHNKLYAYEVYNDLGDSVSVACLDLSSYEWVIESVEKLPTQLHHHGVLFDASARQLIIFGGFGNKHYSKNFYSYNLESKIWSPINYIGKPINPRYFSSLGYSKEDNAMYIFGGMGNQSGDQIVGREYFYDLYKVDLKTRSISKIWEIPWKKENVVPVKKMIILDDSYFYTLCYPEHFSNSFLRLYRFSLNDRNYKILGDSIPIYSDRISTNANLYYDEKQNNLYATVQEFEDDIASTLKIYSISFPPITEEELSINSKQKTHLFTLIWSFITIVIFFSIYLLWRLYANIKKKQEYLTDTNVPQNENEEHKKQLTKPNSISLFGEFTVMDKHNRDITYLFSSKLFNVFCLILQYSFDKEGITSTHLSNLIWPDKSKEKAKNLRGVAINNLRKILSDIEGIKIVYENNCFKIEWSSEFHCDYLECMEIISFDQADKINIGKLLSILQQGKFLQSTNLPIFDSFKDQIEQKLEPVLIHEMIKSFVVESYETTNEIANALLVIDPLNEETLNYQIKALLKLKNDKEAKRRYKIFITEYKTVMGCDFPHSFIDYIL